MPNGEVASLQEHPAGAARSLRVRASRGTLISLVGQGSAQVLRLAGNLVLARLLFPEAFGVMAIVYLVLFGLDQFSNLGIPAAIMRFERGEEPVFLDTAWTMQVVRGFLLWGIGLAVTPFVADFYDMKMLQSILPVATFAAVIMGFISPKLIVLTRRLELGRVVTIEISGQAVALVTTISIAWAYGSIWALVFGGLANQATILLLSHFWIPGPRTRFDWDRDDARAIFSIGKWVFASSGLSFLLAQMDIALLGRLIPSGLLGVYSMGAIIPNLLRDISFRLSSSVLAPVIAESNRESQERLRSRYAAARRLTLPTSLLMALGAAVVAPSFFEFLYDERYADAGWIAQLALLRFWFAYLQVTSCQTLLSMGDGRTWAISNLVGLAGVTTGCLVGFHFAQVPGLLVGMAVGAAAGAAVPLWVLRQLRVGSPLPEVGYSVLGLVMVAFAMAAVHFGADAVPLGNAALRSLVISGLAVSPYAIWAGLRILREVRMR